MNALNEYVYLVFSCLEMRLSDVSSELQQMQERDAVFWKYWQGMLNMKSICFPEPKPGSVHLPKIVLWEPCIRKESTIFFSNYRDGLSHFLSRYSKIFKRNCLIIRLSKPNEEYPAYSFFYYEGGIERRIIQSLKDDPKWTFYQEGEPLPFENVEYYKRRKIRDRLTKEILVEYSRAMGWPIDEDDFWKSDKPAFYAERLSWR